MLQTERIETETPDEPAAQLGRRGLGTKSRTLNMLLVRKHDLELGRVLYPPSDDDPPRPRTRAECREGIRPCPFVSCRHNLYLDVDASGLSIKLNFPDREPDEMGESCALDVAERGEASPEEVGLSLNVTPGAVRHTELAAMRKVGARRFLPLLEHVR